MSDERIYHLAPRERWEQGAGEESYLPAEYEAEGFIHMTQGRELMLTIANRFYRSVPGDFVLLTVDPQRLTAELRWEGGSHGEAQLFPHLYGPLDRAAVTAIEPLARAEDGTFLG